VVSTDASVEHVHFRRAWLTPREIARRAGRQRAERPRRHGGEPHRHGRRHRAAGRLARRDRRAVGRHRRRGRETGTPIVGGDLTGGAELSITVTVLGTAERPLTRSGARAGDAVYVTGTLGVRCSRSAPGCAAPEPSRTTATASPRPSPACARRAGSPPRARARWWTCPTASPRTWGISPRRAASASDSTASGSRACPAPPRSTPAGSGEEYELALTAPAGLDERAFTAEFGVPLTRVGVVEAARDGARRHRRAARGRPPR
jgi:thiamine monophosphate kinase